MIKVDELKALKDKAKTKKDGVYKFNGAIYAVKNGCLINFAMRSRIFEMVCGFMVEIGSYELELEAKKLLRNFITNR